MSLKIRLARGGAKKRPFYSIVIADSRNARDGRFIEKIGTYNPLLSKTDEKRVQYNDERAKYWLSKGAQPTDRVARFFAVNDIVKWEHGNNPKKGEPGAAAKEREAKRAEREAAIAAAANAPAEAPAEAAAEETAAE